MTACHFNGQCHCGAIAFEYETGLSPADWSIRACQCQFCRGHAALSTSSPDARLKFMATNPNKLRRYRFALRTADFLLCSNCGIYIGAVIETDKGRFGIINTRALDPEPRNLAAPSAISYESEVTDGRIARREQRWTRVTNVPW